MDSNATLARNLLSSILALAFPEDLSTDASSQQVFLAQAPQLCKMLTQHNVFGYVTDGKAFESFKSKLFVLIDQASIERSIKAAALDLLLIVVEQCPLEQMEMMLSKLMERMVKMVKYIKDGPRVVAISCRIIRLMVRQIDLYTPELRRELFDTLSKLIPALIQVMTELQTNGAKHNSLTSDELELFSDASNVFVELLDVSPSCVRSSINKLEMVLVSAIFYTPPLMQDLTAQSTAIACLSAIVNASDKLHQLWKQIVDKAIEMAHLHVDLVAQKRSAIAASPPTGMKAWLQEKSSVTADLMVLNVYHRCQAVLERIHAATTIVNAYMKNSRISEREVQLVLNDVIALTRRIVTIRAQEVGKQSAISEDGLRLPMSVVYGILPQLHQCGLAVLSATIQRAGLCALRSTSRIAKTLTVAAENAHAETHVTLCETVTVTVRALGASALDKVGQPLLEQLVAQCKQTLVSEEEKIKKRAEDASRAALEAANKSSQNHGKSKKRKRQAGDLSQLTANSTGSQGTIYRSAWNLQMMARNVNASLSAIGACIAVFGSLLPMTIRTLVSDVAQLALQHQSKQSNILVDNALVMMLLSDAVTSDAMGAHATHLIKSMGYWSSSLHKTSSLMPLVALNVGEALLHPRGPPMSIHIEMGAPSSMEKTTKPSSLPSNVRGTMDWDHDDMQRNETEEPQIEPEVDVQVVTKRIRVDEVGEISDVMGNQNVEDKEASVDVIEEENRTSEVEGERMSENRTSEVEEERMSEVEEEENYDDERPIMEAEPTVTVKATISSEVMTIKTIDHDEDDDDEFPDIVVHNEGEEE